MVVVLLPYNNATTEHLISVSGMSALATHYLNVETFFNKYKEEPIMVKWNNLDTLSSYKSLVAKKCRSR